MAGKDTYLKKNSETAKRGVLLLLFFAVLCLGLCTLRIGYLTLIKGDEYKSKAEAQQLSVKTLNATRGTIYDSKMNVLAQSASVWLVYVNPSKIDDDNRADVINGLVSYLGLDREEITAKLKANEKYGYLKVKGKIEYAEKTALSAYIYEKDLTGVINIDPDTKRYYPNGDLASTVIGFTGSDGNGLYGIEYYYDDELTGTPGRIVTAKDGVQTELKNAFETTYDAVQGTNLVLTIDSEIQTILENALKTGLEENGASNVYGIVMDPQTGAILAMANYPNYDPNDPYAIHDAATQEELDKIKDDAERADAVTEARFSQWKNKSISDFYEPGSVFKIFLVSGAMEEGVINENTSYYCSGTIDILDRTIKDFNPTGHGYETPKTLLVNSCNTFSVYVGQMMGVDLFYKYFDAFGFTEKTGIDIAGEGVPVANVTYYSPDISFSVSDLASSSFGQSISVTPLQIITAASAIANGGKLMTPYIVAKKLDSSGNVIQETKPTVKRQVISEKTASLIASYMEEVVNSGTGTSAYVAGYHVAAKTGTSEKLTSKDTVYLASTAAFAPRTDPKVSVIIVIDEPSGANYSGGVIASPIAGEVIEKTLQYLGIEPSYTESEMSSMTASAPYVIGMSVADAEREVRASKFNVRILGNGDTVIDQVPEADRDTPVNGVIVLYTDDDDYSDFTTVPDFTGLTMWQANQLALDCGLNLRATGGSYDETEAVAYKQEYDPGDEVYYGSFIRVYFGEQGSASD
ncbi:MAG: PASTA domain-containing protein [Clostridia bacterium]|nr:PASTA domain-containing protein [Clostridia bacterium]